MWVILGYHCLPQHMFIPMNEHLYETITILLCLWYLFQASILYFALISNYLQICEIWGIHSIAKDSSPLGCYVMLTADGCQCFGWHGATIFRIRNCKTMVWHPWSNLVNETNLVHYLFSVYFINFIYNLYMFRTAPGPSWGGTTVFFWCIPVSQLYRITSAKCCKNTAVPPDDGTGEVWNM